MVGEPLRETVIGQPCLQDARRFPMHLGVSFRAARFDTRCTTIGET